MAAFIRYKMVHIFLNFLSDNIRKSFIMTCQVLFQLLNLSMLCIYKVKPVMQMITNVKCL